MNDEDRFRRRGQIRLGLIELHKELRQIDELEESPLQRKLAIKLHDRFCKRNHTDGCAFHYEMQENWPHKKYEYDEWVKAAAEVLTDVLDVIDGRE